MWGDEVLSKRGHFSALTLLLAISMLFLVYLPVSAKESGSHGKAAERAATNVFKIGQGEDYATFAAAFADTARVTGNVDFVLTDDTTENVNVPGTNGITSITIESSVEGIGRDIPTVHLAGIPCTLIDLNVGSLNLDVSGGSDYTANIQYCDIGGWSFGNIANAPVGAVTLNINDTTVGGTGPNGHIDVGFSRNYGTYTYNGPITMNLDNVTAHSVSAINGQNLSKFTFNGPITYNVKNCHISYMDGLVFDGSAYASSGGEVQRITANEKIKIKIDGGTYNEVSGGCYKGGAFSIPGPPTEQSYIVNKGADIDIQYCGDLYGDHIGTISVGHFKNYSDADPISHYVWKGDSTLNIVSSNVHSIYGAFNTTMEGNVNMQLSSGSKLTKALRAVNDGGTVTGKVDLTLQGQGITSDDFGGFNSINTGGTIALTKVNTDRVPSMPVTINNPIAPTPPWQVNSHIIQFTGAASLPENTFTQDWSTNDDFPYALKEEQKPSGSLTEQNWILGNGVKVEFKDSKDNLLHTSYIKPGTAVTEPSVDISGYTVAGWYENKAQTGPIWDFNSIINADKVLWVAAIANTYTVKFDPNGGSGSMANQEFAYDTAQNLTANTFTYAGKVFSGWSRTRVEGSTVEFADSAEVKNLAESGTVTLYAVWADLPPVIHVTVEYRDMDNNVLYTESLAEGQTATAPTPAKTGYTLNGWYDTQDMAGKWDFSTPVTADTVLWGKWVPNQYTVTYDPNGGSGSMANQQFTYDTAQNLTANAFTNAEKEFLGWSRTGGEGNAAEFVDGALVKNLAESGTVTLYAVWADKPSNSPSVKPDKPSGKPNIPNGQKPISPTLAPKAPVTGDNSMVGIYVGLCILTLIFAGAQTVRIIYKNKSKSDR